MKNNVPVTCPHCLSTLKDVIADFAYYSCSSDFCIATSKIDRGKDCHRREKIVTNQLKNFLKKKKEK